MKNISVTDLMLIPELSHLRMVEFIDPKHDVLIAPFLKVLGFDLEYPVHFLPCQHRNLQGKVVIGYTIAGEVECNASFLASEWATSEDRIIAAGYRDLSLAGEMCQALTAGRSYSDGGASAEEVLAPDQTNPDEAVITQQIQILADLLLLVRGTPFKQDGSRATLDEYGLQEAKITRERRKASKKVAK